ncbi:hypothetical protein CLOL250_00472 [Clostridium sp. L2-50]|nr:hypothetical protein CLOL250_00472 [Clostridium sp. L2-50]
MVECESILTAQQLSEILVLIDTWWNVNLMELTGYLMNIRVLIDTWWNVNAQRQAPSTVSSQVLIDTWWNVNFQNRSDTIRLMSF